MGREQLTKLFCHNRRRITNGVKIETILDFPFINFTFIRWKRRFENRIDVEIVTPDQDSDAVSGIRQGSVKKVFNNKVHPGNNTESHAKVCGLNII